ncbi:MAG: hypothetical protein U0M42_04440 [Acutalibacteraceae bacterium]|nr:hypothetical protein [Acutalibacteraceae bacterium]
MAKKLIALLHVFCVLLCVSGCGEETKNDEFGDSYESQFTDLITQQYDELEEQESKLNKISDSCDKVLASGYDADNNYYELVANEKEDYSGTQIEMGIIKNNDWIIPLSSKVPFVSETGLLLGAKGNFKGSIYEKSYAVFNFVGAGCFVYKNIIWNGNTNRFYEADEEICISTHMVKGNIKYNINNEGLFIISKYGKNYKLLNANDMSVKDINLKEDGYKIHYCFPYSEGLFACMNNTHDLETNGFYDINGNKVIDLSKYNLARNTYTISNIGGYSGPIQSLVFKNGKCTFTITNDQGSEYEITIDKSGNVINSVAKYSLQGTTQGRYLTGGVPPVRFSM